MRLDFFHAREAAAIGHALLGLPAQRLDSPFSRVLFLVEVNVIRVAHREPMIKELVISDIEPVFIVS